ncbi:MAG: cadherin domain-containing protein, partial [Methyloligellaceae bacterium]
MSNEKHVPHNAPVKQDDRNLSSANDFGIADNSEAAIERLDVVLPKPEPDGIELDAVEGGHSAPSTDASPETRRAADEQAPDALTQDDRAGSGNASSAPHADAKGEAAVASDRLRFSADDEGRLQRSEDETPARTGPGPADEQPATRAEAAEGVAADATPQPQSNPANGRVSPSPGGAADPAEAPRPTIEPPDEDGGAQSKWPTDIVATGGSVDENAAAGTVVATLATVDGDAGDSFTYALTSDPSGFFEIVGNQIRVKAAAAIDFETAIDHDVTVQVTDSDGNSYSEVVTITVNDVNEFGVSAVTDVDAAANAIADSASAGTLVGVTAFADDADATDTVSYTLDDARFTIDTGGVVRVAPGASFDFDTEPTVDITVTATSTDGSTAQQLFTVDVNDLNQVVEPVNDSDATANTVDETAAVGTIVGITALATDPDGTDTVTYSLSNDAGGLFAIDANTGVVTVAGAIDREAAASYDIEVTATSTDGSTSVQSFTIAVNDVDEFSISA